MEKKMNCLLMLSLRDMALRRIAVVLANKPEFLAMILQFDVGTFLSSAWPGPLWRDVERVVSELPLPQSLKKEMIPILKAVGFEIFRWKFIHYKILGNIDVHMLENLCWTAAGAIDYPKTAETLVLCDALYILQRFDLACMYCMEDCIPALWNELPERLKMKVCRGKDPSQVSTPDLQLFLPYIYKKIAACSLYGATCFRRDCYKYSVVLANKAAAEYCLSQLSERERQIALFEVTLGAIIMYSFNGTQLQRPEVLSYLLSLMTSEEQLRIFKRIPCDVLVCFLDWPWQDLCLDIADVVWTFLDEDEYEWLLYQIKFHIQLIGYYLPDFIQEFFLRSPMKFRKHLLDEECRDVFFFNEFFCAEDSQSMLVIFRNIETIDKERLLISEKFLKLFDDFLLSDQRHIVEECIEKAMLSKEFKDRLKEAFAEFVMVKDSGIECDDSKIKRKKFFDLLDGSKSNTTEKRSVEGDTLDQSKKLCTEK